MSTQISISRPIKLEVNTTPITGGVSGLALYNNAGILGELNLSSIYVPLTRTLTINGTTQDLSADRTFTVSTGITIGTTAITSGTVGRVLFEGTGNVVQESANLFWDNTNGRLGIGTSSPNKSFHVVGQSTFNNLIFNDTSAITQHTNIDVKANNAYETGITLSSTSGLRWQIYADNYTSNNLKFYNAKLASQSMIIAGASNNVLINTTTDAGYKLDVNGTAIFRSNITLNSNALYIGANSAMSLSTANSDIYLSNGNTSRKIIFDLTGSGQFQFNNGNVLIGTTSNIVSSKLTIDSTTQGFLPPRMTTTQKNAIATPATGLMVYDTTLNLMALYNGTTWITL